MTATICPNCAMHFDSRNYPGAAGVAAAEPEPPAEPAAPIEPGETTDRPEGDNPPAQVGA
jgi:hypothetical protein